MDLEKKVKTIERAESAREGPKGRRVGKKGTAIF